MRAAVLLPALFLALTACSSEPDFDERYAAAEKQLRERADAIDRQLDEQADGNAGGDAQAPARPAKQ